MNSFDFSVKTPCPEINEMLQKLAFKVGYKWHEYYNVDSRTNCNFLTAPALQFSDRIIYHYSQKQFLSNDNYISLDAAIELLQPKKETATLGQYECSFFSGQDVAVGCQIITAKQISNFIKLWSKRN